MVKIRTRIGAILLIATLGLSTWSVQAAPVTGGGSVDAKVDTETPGEELEGSTPVICEVVKENGRWIYKENGVFVNTYTGFAQNDYGWWYCENGVVSLKKNDVIKGTIGDVSGWWNVSGSKVTPGPTVAKNSLGWWYIGEDAMVDFSMNTVAKNNLGWWYVKDGKVDFKYNGFAENSLGWWYCENGKVTFESEGMYQGEVNEREGWWMVHGSKVDFDTNELMKTNLGWIVVKDGQWDTTANTVMKNSKGWWCVKDGKVSFDYNGFASNELGCWYCEDSNVSLKLNSVKKGIIDGEEGWWLVRNSKYTKEQTVAKNELGWWYVDENGKVDFTMNTVAGNDYGMWKIENGKVNFNFRGIAENEEGLWYMRDGKVNYEYSGYVSYDGEFYKVVEGKATLMDKNSMDIMLIWPLPGHTKVSSPFGYRNCPYHGPELHAGLDIPAPSGTPIVAAADGIVMEQGYNSSMGNYITIQHNEMTKTSYWHCSSTKVTKGQEVKAGDVIGYVGMTGNATGNHLDFRLYIDSIAVDPMEYFVDE